MKKQANAISGLEKMLEDQNVVLAKQTVLMERISAKVFPPESKNLNIFPIDTIDDLEKWTIGDNNPEDVVGLQGGYKNLQNKCFFFLFTDCVYKKNYREARYIQKRTPFLYGKLPVRGELGWASKEICCKKLQIIYRICIW